MTDLVVVIPAFNEEATIAKVIVGTKNYADEIIVVDDGSTDATAAIAQALGVTLLRHTSNLGKGAALRTLAAEAKKKKPKVVVTIDADGQHYPEQIPKISEPILKGQADVVIGVRSTEEGMPRERVIGNRLLDEATSRKAGMKLEDTQSGFRAYSVRALGTLNFSEEGMAVESQTLIDAARAGLKIVGVPISTSYEGVQKKRNPLSQFSEVLDYVLGRTVVESPLLYLGMPGLAAVLVGVVAGIIVVNTFVRTHLIATGTGLVSATLIITGVIALATSLVLKFLKVKLER